MKRALITGGSGGIGAAIAKRLARDGLHVIVHANRNREQAEAVAGEIRSAGGSAETTAFDVADGQASAQVLETLLVAGPIQVLVNNAGIHDDAPLAGMTFEQWHRVVDVTLHGFYHVTQPLLLPMLRTRWGRVISISSIAGVLGNRGHGVCTRGVERPRGSDDEVRRLSPRPKDPREIAVADAEQVHGGDIGG